jgi:hypothetical protein
MATSDSNLLEDMAYAEAEGAAEMDGLEDDMEMFGAGEDEWESDSYTPDGMEDEFSLYEDDGLEAEEAEEAIGQILGNALGAEDEDEFLGKLFKGAKALIKKAAPVVGKIARGAAPILSAIPLPQAQAAAKVAGLLGKLRAEGGTVEDALEAVAEIAVRDRRALPVVAGLAARTVVQNRGAAMPAAQRQQAAKAVTQAAKTLVQNGGPQAIRALPRIAKSVRRTAAASGTPAAVRPKVVARTAAKVARNPALLRRLSAPSPKGQRIAAGAGGGGGTGANRHISMSGPGTITISVG